MRHSPHLPQCSYGHDNGIEMLLKQIHVLLYKLWIIVLGVGIEGTRGTFLFFLNLTNLLFAFQLWMFILHFSVLS
jgi:hypothetical protein